MYENIKMDFQFENNGEAIRSHTHCWTNMEELSDMSTYNSINLWRCENYLNKLTWYDYKQLTDNYWITEWEEESQSGFWPLFMVP